MLVTLLMLAAAAGPPPWPESLKCAAYTQAAAELTKDPATGIPESKAFDAAMFWSLAAMDAARRDKVESAAVAEAAQKTERTKVKPLLAARDPAAEAALADCVKRVPPLQ